MSYTHQKYYENRRNQGTLRWTSYSECIRVEINARTILVRTCKLKIPAGRTGRWCDNIKKDLKINKILVGLAADTSRNP